MNETDVNILVVDDDVRLLDLLVDTLSALDYGVVGAESGQKALEILTQQTFDLMITDIKMPGMDGIELQSRVSKLYPDMPIMFITGVASPEIIGFSSTGGFLAKPFRINKIEEMIQNALKGKLEKVGQTSKEILVVDDDPAFRKMLAEALEQYDYHPLLANDGEEALRMLASSQIEAVITDIKMPGMNGITLMKKIRVDYPDLPVILVTAYLAEEFKEDSIEDQADGYLRKPFRVEKIVELLGRIAPDSED